MAGTIRNCKRCGRVFLSTGHPVCRECLAKEDGQFIKVKHYLAEHPGAGVQETSDETEVPLDVVVEFLRQGLLVTGDGADGWLVCMVCKKPITRGRLCPNCEAALGAGTKFRSQQQRGQGEAQAQAKARMYTMESIGKK